MARRAKGLGMVVIAHDPYASEDKARALGVQLVSFDDALARVGGGALRLFGRVSVGGGSVVSWRSSWRLSLAGTRRGELGWSLLLVTGLSSDLFAAPPPLSSPRPPPPRATSSPSTCP